MLHIAQHTRYPECLFHSAIVVSISSMTKRYCFSSRLLRFHEEYGSSLSTFAHLSVIEDKSFDGTATRPLPLYGFSSGLNAFFRRFPWFSQPYQRRSPPQLTITASCWPTIAPIKVLREHFHLRASFHESRSLSTTVSANDTMLSMLDKSIETRKWEFTFTTNFLQTVIYLTYSNSAFHVHIFREIVKLFGQRAKKRRTWV